MQRLLFAWHANKCTTCIRFDDSELAGNDLDGAAAVRGAGFGRLEARVAFLLGVGSDGG